MPMRNYGAIRNYGAGIMGPSKGLNYGAIPSTDESTAHLSCVLRVFCVMNILLRATDPM